MTAEHTLTADTTSHERRTSTPPWTRAARLVLRIVTTLAAVDAITQAMLAGKFLAGNYSALDLHASNVNILAALTLAMLAATIAHWRLAQGPCWPILAAILLAAAEGGQVALGKSNLLALHVPLGVAIIAALLALAAWSWRTTAHGAARYTKDENR